MREVSRPIIPTYILTPDSLSPTPYRVYSLSDAVLFEPVGVYTVARTFRGDRALLLDAHLDRLEQSAQLVDIPLRLDRAHLRKALRTLLHQAGYADAKFRITVPRDSPDHLYLSLEPFVPVPETIVQYGARLATISLARPNPVAKTTEWMITRRPAQQDLPAGCYEGLLMSADGALLEGLSSNFYGLLDGVLHTAGTGVLEGITRRAIVEIVKGLVPLSMEPIRLPDLSKLSEAMLTSSGRGVVPVTRIDTQIIFDGKPGPVTTEIRRQYERWTEAHLEPI